VLLLTCDDELGPEELGCLLQHVIVNQASLLVQTVWHRLWAAAAVTEAADEQFGVNEKDFATNTGRLKLKRLRLYIVLHVEAITAAHIALHDVLEVVLRGALHNVLQAVRQVGPQLVLHPVLQQEKYSRTSK
jgi:hypothetical protein